MDQITPLLYEILSELFGIFVVALYFMYKRSRDKKKLKEAEEELQLQKLNNEFEDQVLLINSMDFLNSEEGMEKFQEASIVLLKGDTGFYNTVVKNNYGNSGKII